MAKPKTLLLLDANALLHRAWHALPATMKSPDGVVVNAVYGFSSMLMKMLEEYKPDAVAACFDRKEKTFRHDLAVTYKATREKKPDELYAQIDLIKDVLDSFGIPHYEKAKFEADDCIGTISKIAPPGWRVLIVTGDQDELQLVDDRVHVLYLRTGISDMIEFDPAAVREKFGFDPEYLIDYKALRGDTSDNIKGVDGIGEKTATELIKKFGTVEEIFAALEKSPEKVEAVAKSRGMKALSGSKQVALDAKVLTTIVRDVDLDFKVERGEVHELPIEKIEAVFAKYGFKSLMKRLAKFGGKTPEKAAKNEPSAPREMVVREAAVLPKWLTNGPAELGIVVRDGDGGLFATEKTIGLASGDNSICVSESLLSALKHVFKNPAVAAHLHRAKPFMHLLATHGITLAALADDISIASYLLEAGTQEYDLDFLSRKYLNAPIAADCAGQAAAVLELSTKLREELAKVKMMKLYEEMELPLISVLFEMERAGVRLDVDYLRELSTSVTKKLTALEKKILALAGEEFNINSPSQLADILFVKLNLPSAGLKKTKTGISTAAPELEKIADTHPIINLIFDQREMQKLLSTYIDSLPLQVAKDGRIHTTYEQTIAATGRLSSVNPNLQNIPIQTDLGNEIRKAFVADPGLKLIAADYSQIQLRIAAAISRDKAMMEAFKSGADIHTTTASRVFGVPADKVTSEQRRQAKVINFGILYGMGANALARGANMTIGEAREFIAKYFEAHPGIRSFMEETRLLAKSQGYVETLFGRRRAFPDISSGVPQLRASAERMAMNMPIQGAEADIMKFAMLAVARELTTISKDSRLLLQVHDELVLEVPEKDVKKVATFLQKAMETVAKLEVPVVVNVEVGDNWGEME